MIAVLVLAVIGNFSQRNTENNRYKSKFNGQWVNKGTSWNENWVWDEPVPYPYYYVNVYKIADNEYLAEVNTYPDSTSLETIDCGDYKYVEIGLKYVKLDYKSSGSLTIKSV